jgi:hypothetical protein
MLPFLFTLIALGLLPVRLRVSLEVPKDFRVRLRVRWGEHEWSSAPPQDETSLSWLMRLPKMRLPVDIRRLPNLLLTHTRIQAEVACCIGLPDAAATAVATGVLSAAFQVLSINFMAHGSPPLAVHVLPDYHAPGFSLDVTAHVSARLGMLVHALGLLLFQRLRTGRPRPISMNRIPASSES